MAGRIAATVIALIAVLLCVVALPLGVITTAHDRHSFTDEAIDAAASVAAIGEEKLSDGDASPALASSIGELRRGGDQVSLYDRAGRKISGSPAGPAVTAGEVAGALRRAAPVTYPAGDRMLVLAPVLQDEGGADVGVVALSRPTAALDHEIAVLWASIAAVSVAGLVAAALIAIGLARWVSRPLNVLGQAAQRLGDGALDTRSEPDAGPSEVRRLATNFNTMAGRLETLVNDHQAMMADVSHQLRTPLAALRLRLDVLAQDCDEPVAVELTGAQEEIARLSRMVDGLLAVARAEHTVTEPQTVRLDIVIKDRVAAWRPAAEERGVSIGLACRGPLSARLGEGHLEQILDNLLANALDAAPAGGKIMITCALASKEPVIVVADDGPGMSQQQQRAAFRRFTGTTAGGAGLGLAIVHRLVTSNGGSAELSDTPGGGLTVTLRLAGAPRERGPRRQAVRSP
jgi:signal transduction histidine kinase